MSTNKNEDLDTSKNIKGNRVYTGQLQPDSPSEIMIHNYNRNPPPKSILKKKEEFGFSVDVERSYHEDEAEDEGQVLRYEPETLSRSQVRPHAAKDKNTKDVENAPKSTKTATKKPGQPTAPINSSSQKSKAAAGPVSQNIASRIQKKSKI